MELPDYQYQSIDLARDAIRILRILKGTFDSPLRCSLFQSYLDRDIGVPYVALSYTWGDLDASKRPIEIIDDATGTSSYLFILPNAFDAIQYLRNEHEDTYIWIDALCINQSEDATNERNHQVAQMRLVYERAEQVIVWLGYLNGDGTVNAADLTLLVNFANALDRQAFLQAKKKPGLRSWETEFGRIRAAEGYLPGNPNFEKYNGMRRAMSYLLQRPWFTRVWIIQEVANAKLGTVVCVLSGFQKSVPMRTFARLPSLMELDISLQARSILDIMPLVGQKRQGWWNEERDLATLLQKFQNSECSDPRDSVYALLGIISDEKTRNFLRPNYDLSPGQVVERTLSYLLFHDTFEAYNPFSTASLYPMPDDPQIFSGDIDTLPLQVFRWSVRQGTTETTRCLVGLPKRISAKMVMPTEEALSASDRYRILEKQKQKEHKREPEIIDGYNKRVTRLLAETEDRSMPVLHLAMQDSWEERDDLPFLLGLRGLNVNMKDCHGYTALHVAAERGDISTLRLLLGHRNLRIKVEDNLGRTPLELAAGSQFLLARQDAVDILLRYYNSFEEADAQVLQQVYERTKHALIGVKLGDFGQ